MPDRRVVLVTGGAEGIGACIAHRFASAGAAVTFTDSNGTAGKRREREFNAAGLTALFIKADNGKPSDLKQAVRQTLSRFGGLDVLVNNAGIGSPKPFRNRPLSHWDRVLDVNLRGAYYLAQLCAPDLVKRKGAIVNIASSRALQSEPDTEPYSASKGGILALTHSLAVTLSGTVRANGVLPGWIVTDDWRYDRRKTAVTKADHAQHPAGRVGKPEDIAAAVEFLSSPDAGFITGANLVVDGGMTRRMRYLE